MRERALPACYIVNEGSGVEQLGAARMSLLAFWPGYFDVFSIFHRETMKTTQRTFQSGQGGSAVVVGVMAERGEGGGSRISTVLWSVLEEDIVVVF